MGRKEASNMNKASIAPVDQFRKQIGKQDQRKEKKHTKELKQRRDAKSSAMTVSEVVLYVGGVLAILVLMYFGFYWYLGLEPITEENDSK